MTEIQNPQFVVCVENKGYDASLERRKIYLSLPDPEAAPHGLLKVVDESGEDYLYPASLFRPIEVPRDLEQAIIAAA